MLLLEIDIGIDIVIEWPNRCAASCGLTARASVTPPSVHRERRLDYGCDPDSDFDPEEIMPDLTSRWAEWYTLGFILAG
jgi:hypothetical protein